MELEFILAQEQDLDSVIQMFNDAIDEMNRNNIEQWDCIYPNKEIVEEDILKEQLYLVLCGGKLASAYVINQQCEEEYANGEWKYPNSSYYVIHRLCVNPIYQGKGIGRDVMLHIENEIRKMGIDTIRLDAFTLNPYAAKLYEKLGYLKVGVVHWRKGEFYLMEKKI